MPPESNVESTLIWYKSSDKGNIEYWQRELTKFVQSKCNKTISRVSKDTDYDLKIFLKVMTKKITRTTVT